LFREAVVYAKWIIADEERKKAFRKSLPRRKQRKVYQAAIQLYMSKQGDKQWLRKQLAMRAMLRGQEMNKVIKRVWGQQETRQLAMGNHRGNLYGVVFIGGGDEQQGPWRGLWAKKKDTGGQVIEHSSYKDGLMA
jgi:hypothetical protein